MTEPETYPCKFENHCSKFNVKVYTCKHGGGCGCASWRRLTDELICSDENLRRRVQRLFGEEVP